MDLHEALVVVVAERMDKLCVYHDNVTEVLYKQQLNNNLEATQRHVRA